MRDRRPTLAVDFDGVLHTYSKGWQSGACYDEPTEGCRDAVLQLNKIYRLVVFTARHDLEPVREWLRKHRLEHLFEDVTNRKPQAYAYLDDRALRFETWTQALRELWR